MFCCFTLVVLCFDIKLTVFGLEEIYFIQTLIESNTERIYCNQFLLMKNSKYLNLNLRVLNQPKPGIRHINVVAKAISLLIS